MKLSLIFTVILSMHSAFEYGTGDPEHLFPYTRAAQDISSPVTVMNPALLPFCTGLLLSASAGMPYYGYGIRTGSSSVQYTGTGAGLSIRWNSFGCEEYNENSFSAGAGYSPVRWLGAGVTADCFMLSINTDERSYSLREYDSGAGISLIPVHWVQAGLMYRNIRSGIENSTAVYGEWSLGLLVKPCRGLSVSWDLTDNPAGEVHSFVLTVNPLRYISSGFGYSAGSSTFAADFGVLVSGLKFSYGVKFHPYLGYSHAVSITYAGTWDNEPLCYGREKHTGTKRLNINTATFDELISLGPISEKSARRIILYREKIGPVSKKSLVKIGLRPDEINFIKETCYGFEKESSGDSFRQKTGKNKKTGRYIGRTERIKRVFRKLIDSGIPAYQAAIYSDMSQSDKGLLLETLSADTSLSDEKKKIIREICTQ